jgi:hypothetical protein
MTVSLVWVDQVRGVPQLAAQLEEHGEAEAAECHGRGDRHDDPTGPVPYRLRLSE